ncbi:hypothetical protein [Sulfurivermis fontis]|uniref:hypothetical protein n=1 Tax=Sulfurivermis fontis TaxID=1972068 RepID=UPI000FDCAECC|nr:hypothetical protein [Sulfurivermis fontis]
MKSIKQMVIVLGLLALAVSAQAEDKLKPFVLAYKTKGDMAAVAAEVQQKLTAGGFEVVGSYRPYDTATIIAVTNEQLKQTAAKSEFGGYGAAQRVSVTDVNGELQVAYTNPTYMAHAYRMAGDLADVSAQLAQVLGKQEEFGPAEGLTPKQLRKYHYMFGMEYFDEPSTHAMYPSHEKAVKAVAERLAKGTAGVTQVYRIDIPGKDEVVFGVSMKAPNDKKKDMDESFIMSEIDFKPLRSTAHLPYEILVSDRKVYSLYARFRIAINFPDLSMMGDNSFMNIMKSPDAIKNALTEVADDTYKEALF